MGFRIHRGIFQKLNAERTAYENTFKIDTDGRIKEVDAEGEVVAGYLKVGEQATDADTVDGLHSGSFLRSDANDETSGALRISSNWGSGYYSAETFTIRGQYPSLTLRNTLSAANNKWLFHSDGTGKLQMYEGTGYDSNVWDKHFEFDKSGNFTVVSGNITTVGTVFADVFSDRNNTSYYLDPANISYLNDLRPNIIYDRNDTNYYLNLNGDSKAYNFRTTGEFFAEQPAWGGFPLAPNLIHNSYMNKVTNGVPDGWSVLGDITIEAVSPWTKAFEGPYTAEAPANAVDNPEDATESNPYWFSRYYNGPRIGRGGMRSGWHSQGDGKILKVTGSGIVSPAHCAIYPPKEENNLGAKWLFSCFVKIVRGSAFKVGTDAGYRAVSGTQLASKAQTDAGPQGWIRVSGMLGTSQITRLDGLAMSLSIIPDAEGEIEGYIALPYLANATYKGTNYDSWSGSVIDKLARQGLYIHPSNGAVQVSSGTFTIDGNQVATQSWVGSQGYLTSVPSAYATTSYVDTAVSNLVDSAPGALNTLNELAAALGDDANFSTTVTNAIASKADSSHTHGIGDITNATRWWNNFGDNHTTRTSFDAQGSSLTTGFGWRYIQGNGNGPGTDSSPHQFYGLTVGLGNDYNYDNYGMQLVIPRNTATPYISVRFEESRSLGAWQKISAGYADSAGAVAWSNVSGKPSTFAPSSHDHNNLYYTETEADARFLGISAKAADANLLDGVDSTRFVYGGNSTKTTNISSFSTALNSGFFDGNSATGSPTATWYTLLNMRHNNTTNNYGSQIAVSFYSNADMYVRTISNGTYQSWSKIWNSANLSTTNISNWNTAYGWGNHGSAGYASATSLADHKYHSFSNGDQYYDGYGQNNYLRLFTENAVFDNFRFRGYRNVEVSTDGVNWNPQPDLNLDALFDGREETGISITHATKKLRFEIERSTGWPTTALFVIQSTWSNTNGHTGEVILETWDGSAWIQRDTWVYSNFQRGYNLHTTTQVHNGQNSMRVTILMDWNDATHNYLPMRRIMLLSNYSGSVYDMKPFSWNYSKEVTFASSINVSGGNSNNWNTAYGWGNHASAGYLTSVPNLAASKITSGTFANARISQSSVTQHQSALSIAASQVSGLPASAAPVATTVQGGEDSTLASIHFNPDEGSATFTMADGTSYRLAFAR